MRIASLGDVAVVLFAIITAVCQLPADGSGAPRAWGQCAANELAKLTASDAAAEDWFGISVSINGEVVVVGAHRDADAGPASGAAYVYRFDGTNWAEEAKLMASDASSGDEFGLSVSVSGNVAVIGARYDDDAGPNSGSAYVYRFDPETARWVEEAKLTASDAAADDYFGKSVSISSDGVGVVVIGAYRKDGGACPQAGAAYVYRFDGTNWNEEAKLTASDAAAGDYFGWAVSISSGNVAVIGAILEGDGCPNDPNCNAGAAYVYRFDGSRWNEEAKLTASDAAAGDYLGVSVAISGGVTVVGAVYDDDMGTDSGSAYVYRFDHETSSWNEEAKLTASRAVAGDFFGYSVSISGDIAVVGAYEYLSQGTGSAYGYRFDGTDWTEEIVLIASDATVDDRFGISVSVGPDGTGVVGAFQDDDAGSGSGSAYMYRGLSNCNDNATLDICDIVDGTSTDDNGNGIPDECECAWDLDGSGSIGHLDLVTLIVQWGTNPGGPPDFDGDGVVAVPDLLALLAAWGACQ